MNQAALACLLLSLSLVFSGCLSFGDDDDTKEDTDGSTGDDWSLMVKFDDTGDVVSSKQLG